MDVDFRLAQVTAAACDGRFEQALQFTSIPPDIAHGARLKRLGDMLHHAGQFRASVACYTAALAETPPAASAAFNRGVSYKSLGEYDQAAASFLAAIEAGVEIANSYAMLGAVYFLANDFDQSIAYYDKSLALDDNRFTRYGRSKSILAREDRLNDAATVFGNIYAQKAWGDDGSGRFYSGIGSHDPKTVNTYVEAVAGFLNQLEIRPTVVDVGCGDFNIGSRIRPYCDDYRAFDVVPEIIAQNRERFAATGVVFATLDVTREAPPPCDVLFIREVFQHLSNAQVSAALDSIKGSYRYLVFTEVEPSGSFIPNQDKTPGENIRLTFNRSAVVLTAPPFSLQTASERLLCSVDLGNRLIKTYLYAAA